MSWQMFGRICLAVWIFSSVVAIGLVVGYFYQGQPLVVMAGEIGENRTDNNETFDCKNKSLEQTAECLNRELMTFYNYNLSRVGEKLSEAELREQGGVCEHYADWYIEMGKRLGFNTEKVAIKIDSRVGHAFAVISNSEGYCIMDQNTARCKKLKQIDWTLVEVKR